jgi:ABC-type Fe3+/spermidine/putrescine transport system ATPase subunit
MTGESSESALLSVRKLSKHFGGTAALESVDVDFHAAEVHALLGENGAGKSTLIKILAGVYRQDSGDVLWRGKPEHPVQERLPIVFIHQDLGLVEEMTVAENIGLVAGYPITPSGLSASAWFQAESQPLALPFPSIVVTFQPILPAASVTAFPTVTQISLNPPQEIKTMCLSAGAAGPEVGPSHWV